MAINRKAMREAAERQRQRNRERGSGEQSAPLADQPESTKPAKAGKPARRKAAPQKSGKHPAMFLLLLIPLLGVTGYLIWDKAIRKRTLLEKFSDLLEELREFSANEVSQVDPAFVAETLKLFRELRSRSGFNAHMGRPEKHEEEGDKIERQLVEVEAHLRKQRVTHDEAIKASDTGYRLFNGYNIWTLSMEPKEGASPSDRSVIYGMRDRIKSRMSKINGALWDRAIKFDLSAVDRAESEWKH